MSTRAQHDPHACCTQRVHACAGAPDGWVYFVRVHRNLIKVGWSRRPEKRLGELRGWYTRSHKYRLRIISTVPAHRYDEFRVHGLLAPSRVGRNLPWPRRTSAREEYAATPAVLNLAQLVNNNRAALLGALGMATFPPHSTVPARCGG